MKTLVTGATGHVGANLVRALLDAGRDVRVVVRDDTRALEGLEVERVRADVRDAESLRRAVAGCEVVYHLAAIIDIEGGREKELIETNVDGARRVAEICAQADVGRLIHVSSIHATSDEPAAEVIDESRAPARDNAPAYDRAKAAGELAVRQVAAKRGLHTVILRPTGIIGPHDYKPSALGQALLKLLRRQMPALVEGGYDWVDVRDVVSALMTAEEKGKAGETFMISGHWASVKELAEHLENLSGVPAPRFVTPFWIARAAAPFAAGWARLWKAPPVFTPDSIRALRCHRHISSARASARLGYRPRPLRESIEDAYRWYVDNGVFKARASAPSR